MSTEGACSVFETVDFSISKPYTQLLITAYLVNVQIESPSKYGQIS